MRPLHRKCLRFLGGALLALAALLLLAFNGLLLWVATGPRSLDQLSPYITAALEPADHAWSVSIGQTRLVWDGWQHPIDLRLREVKVVTREGETFSSFPEISLGVDVLSLPLGRILPTSLTLMHPVISLFQNDDRTVSFGFRQQAVEPNAADNKPPVAAVPFAAVLTPFLTPDDAAPEYANLRKLRFITITNADISVGNKRDGVFFKAGNANIIFRRDWRGNVKATGSAKISYDRYESLVSAQFIAGSDSSVIDGNVSFSQLMPGTLAALFSDNAALGALKFPMSGKGQLTVDKQGNLQKLAFALDGGKGTIESKELEAPLKVTSLHAQGVVGPNAKDIQVSELTANLDGMLLTADGTAFFKDNDAAIKGHAALKNVSASNVHILWPATLSPESRKWVITNITDGKVTEAQVQVNIPYGDLAKPVLPQADIDASLTLEGAKIRYLPEHPEVSHVNGTLHIDALTLTADITSGDYMKDTKLSSGKLAIEDLNADNPYIKVSFNADSSAKDVVRLLGLPRLQHAAKLGLSEATASGNVKGSAALGFSFFAPHDASGNEVEADIDYDITAQLKNVTQPGFMKRFDVKNAEGTLTVQKTGLHYQGKGEVNGAVASAADVRYLFTPEAGFDTLIDVTAVAPIESLPRFGYPAFAFLKGTMGVKALVKEGTDAESSVATFDLTNTAINYRNFALHKPPGVAATFDLTAEKKNGVVSFTSLQLKGKDINVKGSAELTKDLSDFRRVTLGATHYGQVDLDRVLYEPIDGGMHIEASGNSADLSGWLGTDESADAPAMPEDGFSFQHFPALTLQAKVGRVILGKERELAGVKASVNCDAERCNSADVSGQTTDKKNFSFRILHNAKGLRQLSVQSGNAGAFLHAINVFDGMEGGELSVTGVYNDSGDTSVLKGHADISEHTVKHAPVLAKILSIASLTGFFDTLQGNGIRFVHSYAPFTLTKDVITVKDAKTHGPAIGLTASGTITFPKQTLDIQGTLVPSYTLNNVLGKVPLVGNLLTGGEGQGVFAARYSIKGFAKNPDVTVNPLSILTPGFLRGVFDIMDTPKKEDEQE